MITVLYGVAIRQAAVSGDLEEMKSLERQAENQLAEQGDLRAALEVLKLEIAKLEKGRRA